MVFNLTFKELQVQSPKLNQYWEENSEWIGEKIVNSYKDGNKKIYLTINEDKEHLEFIVVKLKELGYNVRLYEVVSSMYDQYKIYVQF